VHARSAAVAWADPVPVSCSRAASAREDSQDFCDGGFLAGGFRAGGFEQRAELRLDLVAVAAADFLLHRVAAAVRPVTMLQALRPVMPWSGKTPARHP
jgi:hypothetical protein